MIDSGLITSIVYSFEKGESLYVDLPLESRLVVDQKLPFLCVYRFTDSPDFYLSSLIKTQGAYLIVHADLDVSDLLVKLIDVAIRDFKSYMILEMWNSDLSSGEKNIEIWYPAKKTSATVDALQKGFSGWR